VNLLCDGNTLVVSKPFGPRNGSSSDVFETDVVSNLPGFNVRFIDDWYAYHLHGGEIHCGTNVKRTPPALKWWQ